MNYLTYLTEVKGSSLKVGDYFASDEETDGVLIVNDIRGSWVGQNEVEHIDDTQRIYLTDRKGWPLEDSDLVENQEETFTLLKNILTPCWEDK